MKIIKNLSEYKAHCLELYSNKMKTSFVPTMGSLHAGHLSLIKKAKELSNHVIVSIFVNPTQFNDKNDFINYPNNLREDLDRLEKLKVNTVFCPETQEIYPNGTPEIQIDFPLLTSKLCGKSRKGHFQGVLYIVHNLLIWTKAAYAVFGLKDYQQFLLISMMARELALETEIIGSPLIRDVDGIALSSRNVRLSKEARAKALTLSKTLLEIEKKYKSKELSNCGQLTSTLNKKLSNLQVEYAGVYHPTSLQTKANNDSLNNSLIAVAIEVENVRLIDNLILK